jgi:hypothetical protein
MCGFLRFSVRLKLNSNSDGHERAEHQRVHSRHGRQHANGVAEYLSPAEPERLRYSDGRKEGILITDLTFSCFRGNPTCDALIQNHEGP